MSRTWLVVTMVGAGTIAIKSIGAARKTAGAARAIRQAMHQTARR